MPYDHNSPAPDWESEIGALLAELSGVQQELLDVLAEKRRGMIAADEQAMAALVPREEQLAERLAELHERRGGVLARAGEAGLPGESLQALLAHLEDGPREPLAEQVRQAAHQARVVRRHSLTNWVLAQQSLLHLAQLLEIIATGGRIKPTYSEGEAARARGSLVDRAA